MSAKTILNDKLIDAIPFRTRRFADRCDLLDTCRIGIMNDFVYSQMYLMDSHASNGIWMGQMGGNRVQNAFRFFFWLDF